MPALTINYAHAWESMHKGIDDQGPYYKVSYYFSDWNDSDTVANQLRGYTSRTGTTTIRVAPHAHPLSSNLTCADVQIEGCGAPVLNSLGLPYYSAGFFAHTTYRAWPAIPFAANDPFNLNQIDPSTPILWATQELDFTTEEYVHESNEYVWETGDALNGKPTGIPVRVTLGVTILSITFHQLPYLPTSVIAGLRNKINTSTFLGFDPYTVLFVGGRTIRDMNTDGTACNKVMLHFKQREQDWRKFLRKDKIAWAKIKDSSGTYSFTDADLTPLIQL